MILHIAIDIKKIGTYCFISSIMGSTIAGIAIFEKWLSSAKNLGSWKE